LKNETAKVTRWVLLTQKYNVEVKFRPGSANANADGLSRIPLPTKTYLPSHVTTAPICLIVENLTSEQGKDAYCNASRETYDKQVKRLAVREEVYHQIQGNDRRQKKSGKRNTLSPPNYGLATDLQESDSEEE
jgi:hypothetical protein